MPELPEVQTTVNGINKKLKGLTIRDVWTDYGSPFHTDKKNIKDSRYFLHFKKAVGGATISHATRRAKNILIHLLNNKTILIHMKMTGHLLYGAYSFNKSANAWVASGEGPLKDPRNKFIHLVFTLSNGKYLAFSDMRKFGKVFVEDSEKIETHRDLAQIGPEPLTKEFTLQIFKDQIKKKPNRKIKQVLMDQSVVAGVGNIYSDELLWLSSVHPASTVKKIPSSHMKKIYLSLIEVLKKGIDFGGDSMSDYRNLEGERGRFQHTHNAYRLTGQRCKRDGCGGIITRIKIGGRSGHFCN